MNEIAEVVLGMWPPYIISTRTHVAEAEGRIVPGKFPTVRHLVEAVDLVRRKQHADLYKQGATALAGPSTAG